MVTRKVSGWRNSDKAIEERWALTRNQFICKQYAQWYLDHPQIFKWAGIAAFASHRVGILLAAYDLVEELQDVAADLRRMIRADWTPKPVPDPDEGERLATLELLRQGNELVFEDIGWAHDTYVEHGVAAIQAKLAGMPTHELMLAGFCDIDDGKQLLARDPDAAAERIWRGNLLLLKHEQSHVVQSQLGQIRPGITKQLLSRMTWMDFRLESLVSVGDILHGAVLHALRGRPDHATAFHTFLGEHGGGLLADPGDEPDFTVFEQRWFWVEKKVFPLWRECEGSDRLLRKRMRLLIDQPLAAARLLRG